jgi:hypothetical protein
MTILQIIQYAFLILSILTGLISLFVPLAVRGFTGLEAPGVRGISEIRAILGGTFIGLGLAPFLFNTPAAYRAVGLTFICIAVARAASIVIDRSFAWSNIASLSVEALAGIVLVL